MIMLGCTAEARGAFPGTLGAMGGACRPAEDWNGGDVKLTRPLANDKWV